MSVNSKQNRAIAALQRQVASLRVKKSRLARKPSNRTNGQGSTGQGAKHPLHAQAVALLQPFKTGSGLAQALVDALPSQKLTLRSRNSISVPAGGCMLGFVCPYFWVDTARPSSFVFTANSSSLAEASTEVVLDSTVAGTNHYPAGFNGGTSTTPVRPHSFDITRTCRLVSYGLRLAYTGTALNANGRLKFLATPHGELGLQNGALTGNVITTINSSHHTQMKAIYDQAVYEFSMLGNPTWSPAGTGADLDEVSDANSRYGQASHNKYVSEPGAAFYYVNNSTSSVTFEIEVVEHWEARGPNLAPFYTDSHTDPAMHHEIMNVVNTAHAHAGLSGEKKFATVVSSVAKASKSPLGKAVLTAALA